MLMISKVLNTNQFVVYVYKLNIHNKNGAYVEELLFPSHLSGVLKDIGLNILSKIPSLVAFMISLNVIFIRGS